MDQIDGLRLIGILALGLLLVYIGGFLNRKQPKRERAAAGDTAASNGDSSHDTSTLAAFLPWLSHGHDSKSDLRESGSSSDAGGGWCGGDSGGDGGGGGGGE